MNRRARQGPSTGVVSISLFDSLFDSIRGKLAFKLHCALMASIGYLVREMRPKPKCIEV